MKNSSTRKNGQNVREVLELQVGTLMLIHFQIETLYAFIQRSSRHIKFYAIFGICFCSIILHKYTKNKV